jgi:hypothetical protein
MAAQQPASARRRGGGMREPEVFYAGFDPAARSVALCERFAAW